MRKVLLKASDNPLGNYKIVLMSCFIGTLISSLLLILSAFVISKIDFPQKGIALLAVVVSVIGSFFSGYICCKMTKSGGLLYGIICGSFIFLLSLLCEVSILNGEIGILGLYKFIIHLTAAMIGGVMGVNHRRKVR